MSHRVQIECTHMLGDNVRRRFHVISNINMHYEVALPPASSVQNMQIQNMEATMAATQIEKQRVPRLNSKSDKRTIQINAADNSYYTLTQPSELLLFLLHPRSVIVDNEFHTITSYYSSGGKDIKRKKLEKFSDNDLHGWRVRNIR
uniref:Uncharacterized protein n=1 Tax=Glossina pallidipes TaxID=7398 RepID=A0A1A9Z4D9_GLOPL